MLYVVSHPDHHFTFGREVQCHSNIVMSLIDGQGNSFVSQIPVATCQSCLSQLLDVHVRSEIIYMPHDCTLLVIDGSYLPCKCHMDST